MTRNVQVGDDEVALSARRGAAPDELIVRLGGDDSEAVTVQCAPDGTLIITEASGRRYCAAVTVDGASAWVSVGGMTHRVMEAEPGARGGSQAEHGLEAPMPGKILRILVAPGAVVARGETLLIVEAMKMEHAIKAPREGVVEAIRFSEGDLVSPGEALVTLGAADGDETS